MKHTLKFALAEMLLVSCKEANQSKAMDGVMDEVIGNNNNIH